MGTSYQSKLLFWGLFIYNLHDLGTFFIFNLLHRRISKVLFIFTVVPTTEPVKLWCVGKCGRKEGIAYINLV